MSIGRLVKVLGHHWRLVSVLTVALLAGVAAVVYTTVPSYRASALLQVQAPLSTDGTVSLQDTLSARERAVTIVALGNTWDVAQRAAKTIGSGAGIKNCSFAQSGQSEFLNATCTGTVREAVAGAANAYATALQTLLETQRQAQIAEVTAVYQKQVAVLKKQGVTPANFPAPPIYPSYREIEVIDSAATPRSAFAPRPLRTLMIAFVLGLLVNTGLAFLLEHVQNRARSPEELRNALGLPVLVAIPKFSRSSGRTTPAPVQAVVRAPRREARAGAAGEP